MTLEGIFKSQSSQKKVSYSYSNTKNFITSHVHKKFSKYVIGSLFQSNILLVKFTAPSN